MVFEEQASDIGSQPVTTVSKPVVRGKSVSPGDVLGTEEEFLAGKGTWTDLQGNIRAVVMGELVTDEHRKISVVPANMPPDIHEGTVIYGRIDEMFESVAFVTVEAMSSGSKPRMRSLSGVIPVSEIKDAFVDSIRQEMRVGDIVRAVVSKLTPFRLELTVKPQGMGVVKAFCSYDRQPMELKGGAVVCTVCGQRETRHLGEPYGDIGPMGDVKLVARPRGPRSEGGFGGGRGGPRGGYGDRGPRRDGGYRDRGPRREGGYGDRGPHRDGGRPSGFGGRGAGQARY